MAELKPMHDRTYEFGLAVIAEYRRAAPADEAEAILWSEVLKTQKSMATNTAESDGTNTRKDFAAKFQIALKESRECFQLLRMLAAISPSRRDEVASLLQKCDEIIAILVKSLKTAKRNDAAEKLTRRQ